jgi:excisionase family DNA binding protein
VSLQPIATIADSIEQLDRALTAPELARLLAVDRATIYRQAQAGILPCFRIGATVRFEPRAVAAWLRDRETR